MLITVLNFMNNRSTTTFIQQTRSKNTLTPFASKSMNIHTMFSLTKNIYTKNPTTAFILIHITIHTLTTTRNIYSKFTLFSHLTIYARIHAHLYQSALLSYYLQLYMLLKSCFKLLCQIMPIFMPYLSLNNGHTYQTYAYKNYNHIIDKNTLCPPQSYVMAKLFFSIDLPVPSLRCVIHMKTSLKTLSNHNSII